MDASSKNTEMVSYIKYGMKKKYRNNPCERACRYMNMKENTCTMTEHIPMQKEYSTDVMCNQSRYDRMSS